MKDDDDEDSPNKTDDANSSGTAEFDQYGEPIRKYKALCYEDICVWIVQNPRPGGRDLFATIDASVSKLQRLSSSSVGASSSFLS